MRIAVVGSRTITKVDLEKYLENCDEIVSGGAKGIDCCAAEYARKNNIKLTEFLPKYSIYGKGAPIKRNQEIVNYADKIIVFWDERSKGALSVINYAKKVGKACQVIICKQNNCE